MKFLQKLKLQKILLALTLFILPIISYAYSKQIIPGGQTIGIQVESKGVLIVGFYKVNDTAIAEEAGFKVGDTILSINQQEVKNIAQMIDIVNQETLNQNNNLDITIKRKEKLENIKLNLICDNDNICKTGLYVKDEITGIGTLTYIDPSTKIFGALGHEILEKTTGEKFEIKDGKIYEANITSTTKSRNGSPGEKNANFNKNNTFGNIFSNKQAGIFGLYREEIDENTIEIATKDEIKLGKATIRTVVDNNQIKEYEINILKINPASPTKNLLFEITDKNLLEQTGGIIQGMSGSPIIQNQKIIGAVTHVIVNDTKKGYGIFITTMLEEGEKKSDE